VLDMTIVTTIAYVLAGFLAAAITFIGARFLVAPRVAPPVTACHQTSPSHLPAPT